MSPVAPSFSIPISDSSCHACSTLLHFTLTPRACGPTPSLWVAASTAQVTTRQSRSLEDASSQHSSAAPLCISDRTNCTRQWPDWSLLWLQRWEIPHMWEVPHICWVSPKWHMPQPLQFWAKWLWFTLAHICVNLALFSFEHLTDSKKKYVSSTYSDTMSHKPTYFLMLSQQTRHSSTLGVRADSLSWERRRWPLMIHRKRIFPPFTSPNIKQNKLYSILNKKTLPC